MSQKTNSEDFNDSLERVKCRVMQGEPLRKVYLQEFPRYYLDTTPQQREEMLKFKPERVCNPCEMKGFVSALIIYLPRERHVKFKKYCKQKNVDMSQLLSLHIRELVEAI
jgi:hypothetical protein